MQKVSVRTITNVAMLIALEIVLARLLSINTPITRIGFGFIPLAICGIMYGPVWAGIAAGTADILGITILNTSGASFFPGITLTAILTGVSYGFFLNHKNNPKLLHTTAAAAVNNFILSLFLQTYWLTILMGKGFTVLFPTRIAQAVLLFAVQAVTLPLLVSLTNRLDKYLSLYPVSANADNGA